MLTRIGPAKIRVISRIRVQEQAEKNQGESLTVQRSFGAISVNSAQTLRARASFSLPIEAPTPDFVKIGNMATITSVYSRIIDRFLIRRYYHNRSIKFHISAQAFSHRQLCVDFFWWYVRRFHQKKRIAAILTPLNQHIEQAMRIMGCNYILFGGTP